jgi:hypothetical protein
VPGALSCAGTAGKEGRAYVIPFFISVFELPKQKRSCSGVGFVYEHNEEARDPPTGNWHGT